MNIYHLNKNTHAMKTDNLKALAISKGALNVNEKFALKDRLIKLYLSTGSLTALSLAEMLLMDLNK